MRWIIVLLSQLEQADVTVRMLRSKVRPAQATDLQIVRPPLILLGTGFWVRWREAREWWESTVEGNSAGAILLIDDMPGLEYELRGLTSEWVVWCWDEARAGQLATLANVTVILAPSPEAFAHGVLEHYGPGGAGAESRLLFRPAWGPFAPARTAAAPPPGERVEPPRGAPVQDPPSGRPPAADRSEEIRQGTTGAGMDLPDGPPPGRSGFDWRRILMAPDERG